MTLVYIVHKKPRFNKKRKVRICEICKEPFLSYHKFVCDKSECVKAKLKTYYKYKKKDKNKLKVIVK